MKRLITYILFLFSIQQLVAQTNIAPLHPTYRELKEAGLLGKYTSEQLIQLQEEEVSQVKLENINHTQATINLSRHMISQTSSSAFAVSPINPLVCPGDSVSVIVNNIAANAVNLYIDDGWSNVINLGFAFKFYGTYYTQCVVGSNGSISFNTSVANTYQAWCISSNQPASSPTEMKNTINCPWQDLYLPAGGSIKYSTVGTAPYRIFVVEYCNVPPYYNWCDTSRFTGQIQLFEGTNRIETHIFNKPCFNCSSWNNQRGLHSVQNVTGAVASVVTGRNASDNCWTISNEGKRWNWNNVTANYDITSIPFTPVAFLNNSSISWYDSTNNVIGTGTTYTTLASLPIGTYVYYALISQAWCQGSIDYVAYDTITVNSTLAAPTASASSVCYNTSATLSGSCGANCVWYNVATGGTPLGTGFFTTPALTFNHTYYVEYSSGACTSPRTPVNVTVAPALAYPTVASSTVCNSIVAGVMTADCGINCEWFSTPTGGSPIGTGPVFTSIPPTTIYYVQKNVGGCISPRTTAQIYIGNLSVNASGNLCGGPYPAPITTTYTGAVPNNTVVENSVASNDAPSMTPCSPDPGNMVGCPSSSYVTRTITSPAGMNNPIDFSSIKSIYLKISNDDPFETDYSSGQDVRVWLKSPAGTVKKLVGDRPFNAMGNLCYCPTFVNPGTNVVEKTDVPFNGTSYIPDDGALSTLFPGENPYANSGVWTLILWDENGYGCTASGSCFDAYISDFKMTFRTYPTPTYQWVAPAPCGNSLSSLNIANPTYTPPNPPWAYCNFTVTVISGGCSGTASLTNCIWLSADSNNLYKQNEVLNVIPNPAINNVNVAYISNTYKEAIMRIYDYSGKLFFSKEIIIEQGENKYPLVLSDLNNGLYIVTLQTEKEIMVKRFVKE